MGLHEGLERLTKLQRSRRIGEVHFCVRPFTGSKRSSEAFNPTAGKDGRQLANLRRVVRGSIARARARSDALENDRHAKQRKRGMEGREALTFLRPAAGIVALEVGLALRD